MKYFIVFLILIAQSFAISASDKIQIESLYQAVNEIEEWQPSGEKEIAIGEDLYYLINGGAEIYNEYGFSQALYQSYRHETGNSINLEIYEMVSQEAAYGIYTFKTSTKGKAKKYGNQGWFESYYLNFWSGHFLITIVGLDTNRITLQGIELIAKTIDAKLNTKSKTPDLISFLPVENILDNGMVYLKGNIALANQYVFDYKNIFGLKKGVLGIYADYRLFIFEYENPSVTEVCYKSAKETLQNSDRFSGFSENLDWFEIIDQEKQNIRIKHHNNRILIIIGNQKNDFDAILGKTQDRFPEK